MPLLDGAQVSPLPLPHSLSKLSPDTEVWSIDQTAEIFLDYESYANRYIFYSQPVFTPHSPSLYHNQSSSSSSAASSNQLVSFFDALDIEAHQLDQLIQSDFPHPLKRRLLLSVLDPLSQLEPSIDRLVNHLFLLHHNRFDVDQRVLVDLSFGQQQSVGGQSSSSVYSAKVVKVFPPKAIRDLDKQSYSELTHLRTTERFGFDLKACLQLDDASAYLYTIQLMDDDQSKSENGDQEDHFGASYMEVEPRKLTHHPHSFSKPLLKKLIQSVLLPHLPGRSGSRWRIRADVLRQYQLTRHPHSNLPSTLTLNNDHGSTKKLKKRPKWPPHNDSPSPSLKRQKKKLGNRHLVHPSPETLMPPHPAPSYQDYLQHTPDSLIINPRCEPQDNLINPTEQIPVERQRKKKKKKWRDTIDVVPSQPVQRIEMSELPPPPPPAAAVPLPEPEPVEPCIATAVRELKKTIKYPIEDLDLNPLTIIDGRYLRRLASTSLTLPQKPLHNQMFKRKYARLVKLWSFINIFELGELGREKFEDFETALETTMPRLVKMIEQEPRLRYPTTRGGGFTSSSILPFFSSWPVEECEVMSIDEREYWVRKGIRFSNLVKKANGGPNSKKKNPKVAEDDWTMSMVEIMCQRGGIERLGCLGRMMKYFFSISGQLVTIDHDKGCEEIQKVDEHKDEVKPKSDEFSDESELTVNEDESNGDEDRQEEEAEEAEHGYETGQEDGRRYGRSMIGQRSNQRMIKKTLKSRFSALGIDDKLMIVEFFCDLVMESDHVRNYMEECDERLTVVRKEKADVNKEKRRVLDELARCEGKKTDPLKASPVEDTPTSSINVNPSHLNSYKTSMETNGRGTSQVLGEEPLGGNTRTSKSDSDTAFSIKEPKVEMSERPARSPSLVQTLSPTTLYKPTEKKSEPIKLRIRAAATPTRVATLASRQIKQPTSEEGEREKLESQLFDIGLRELELNERFRRYIGVSKLRPMGIDRFYCKYWWFDGIGGLNFEDEMKWFCGCIFVCGPSFEDLERIKEIYGADEIEKRRIREEGNEMVLGFEEWAVYETEEQIEGLLNWLNPKGCREMNLKQNLREWKEYILYGVNSRQRSIQGKNNEVDIQEDDERKNEENGYEDRSESDPEDQEEEEDEDEYYYEQQEYGDSDYVED